MRDVNDVGSAAPEAKVGRSRQARAESLREAARKARAEAKVELKRAQELALKLEQKAKKLDQIDKVRMTKERSNLERRVRRAIVTALTAILSSGNDDMRKLAMLLVDTLDATHRPFAEEMLGLSTMPLTSDNSGT